MDEIKEEFEKLEITCLAGIVLGQCEYIHLSKNRFGCNYKYYCGFQRPNSNCRQSEIEKLTARVAIAEGKVAEQEGEIQRLIYYIKHPLDESKWELIKALKGGEG